MNMWIALLIAGTVVLGAAGAATYYLTRDDARAPDLALHTKFPAGYDRRTVDLAAVTFDGKSRCIGLWNGISNLVKGQGVPWTHDGIASTTSLPTSKDVRHANPVRQDDYDYVGSSPKPWKSNETGLSDIQDGSCSFEYDAQAWSTKADIANTEATEILDVQGTPYTYARTNVLLGGNGDGKSGTRFILQGSTTLDNFGVDYQVYDADQLAPAHRVTEGRIAPTFHNNGTFAIIFDVPANGLQTATLVLIPVRASSQALAVQTGEVTFDSLMRLETQQAQVTIGATDTPSNAVTYKAETLDAAWSQASSSTLVKNFEAVSSTATIVQGAFEPQAPIGKTRHYQTLSRTDLHAGNRLDLTEANKAASIDTTYAWKSTSKEAKLVIQQSGKITNIPEAAKATAALSQLGADGIAIAQAAAQGPSARAAVESAHRLLDAKGQVIELEAKTVTSGIDLLHGPDKYFLAAGALAAGWEWSEAVHSDDVIISIGHQLQAARIVAETLFSLTPQGAILVAATNLAAYAVGQIIPQEWQQALNQIFNAAILGRVPEATARRAFDEAAPQITTFAKANHAGILAYKVEKTNDVPALEPYWLLGLLLFVGVSRSRKL